MKYIRLFEEFDANPQEAALSSLFNWMPYDKEKDNPIQESMPKDELNFEQLKSFINEAEKAGNIGKIQEAGLFMAHEKTNDGGFIRTIVRSFSPLRFDIAKFNDMYEEKASFEDVNPEEVDVKKLSKGASVIQRFGGLDLKPSNVD